MIAAVCDTHTLIWWLFNNPKLSANAAQSIHTAAENHDKIIVSSITLIEVVYLIEKGKIPLETMSAMARILQTPNSVFQEVPINLDIARTLNQIEAWKVPDMPDRIIAATAAYFKIPVISKDGKIQLSGLQTI